MSSETAAWENSGRLDSLLQSLGAGYAGECGGSLELAGATIESVRDTMSPESFTCLVCIEEMRPADPIWSCPACYRSQHLGCLVKWIRSGADAASADGWTCPNCRGQFRLAEAPSRYRCYCGKLEDPPFDPWLLPHSCGERCDRQLPSDCGHSCLLLCHPGRCPPCPRTVHLSCHCGQRRRSVRCGQTWSCGGECGRRLCDHGHKCRRPCHPGDCEPCDVAVTAACQCGAESRQLSCSQRPWQCGRVCSRRLACGRHACGRVCHSGQCGACPTAEARTCPCGKRQFPDLPCTEDAPTCSDTCGKVLPCGQHRCPDQCHVGECPPCREMVRKSCRCGRTSREIQCHRGFTCDCKCTLDRGCGRHQCKRRCCPGNCPPCESVCGRQLNCGQHKCQSPCHSGQCYPCRERQQSACACGFAKVSYACGARNRPRPPRCPRPCLAQPDCDHSERAPHPCHSGQCPPCRLPCGAVLACGHACAEPCHAARLVTVRRQLRGQWEGPQEVTELQRLPCPPCSVPVTVACLGGHEETEAPCSEAQPRACGRQCGAAMGCGRHLCELLCHEQLPNDPRHSCERTCDRQLPGPHCRHRCPAACHNGPCPPCRQSSSVRCHCGASKLRRTCQQLAESAASGSLSELLRCPAACPKRLACGHPHSAPCHPGDCGRAADVCQASVELRCRCRRRQKLTPCRRLTDDERRSPPALECDARCEAALAARRLAAGNGATAAAAGGGGGGGSAEEVARRAKEREEEELRRRLPQVAGGGGGGGRRSRRAANREPRDEAAGRCDWLLPLAARLWPPLLACGVVAAVVCLLAWAALSEPSSA